VYVELKVIICVTFSCHRYKPYHIGVEYKKIYNTVSLMKIGKTTGCHCSHWAPDDRRENARNML